MGRAVPILASTDLGATLAFYERLGFENRGAPPEEWDYLILGRDEIELHFIGSSGSERGPGSCYLFVDDAEALHGEWRARVGEELEPPVVTEYGMREFAIRDPHGNELRVGSPS